MRSAILVGSTVLLLAACSREAEAPPNNAAAAAEPAANPAAQPADAAPEANAAAPDAPTFTLTGNGLAPGITFGMARIDAVAAARAVFGTPTGRERNEECGQGPMEFVSFRGLALEFQEGRLAGWSLSGRDPALRTAAGLAIGAPRSVLGDAEIDEESTLGPEFLVDGVGGLLDEGRSRIEALWAGSVCQFR